MREAAVEAVAPVTTPNSVPHTMDWKAWVPRGTPMPLVPSMLSPGMATYPEGQALLSVEKMPKESGDVVDDAFQRIPQYPSSVLTQLV